MGISEEGESVLEVPVTHEQAGSMLLSLLGAGELSVGHKKPAEVASARPEQKSRAGKKKGGAGGHRGCKICGKAGHYARTCPKGTGKKNGTDGSEDEAANSAEARKSARVKQMLKEGHAEDFIATETGTTLRVIKFIRSQMVSRGEL